ncbi:hypothetical protein GBA52_011835 [Prunus armeniaca]|nr:hypothetical protein GBA52_011835 [Prunus armeniaca]
MERNGVSPFSLDIQIAQYRQLKSRTTSLYNRAKKQPHRFPRVDDFSKALYIFDIGQNDVAAGIRKMSDEQFQAQIPDIINQLATAIRVMTLHYLHNPSPDYVDRRGCVKFQNDMARQFNRALKQKVFQLRKELLLAAITHVNVFAAKYKLLSNAKKHAIASTNSGPGSGPAVTMELWKLLVASGFFLASWVLGAGAKNPSDRSTLPNPQDFAKALYTYDIGQNDLSVGFRKLSFDQIRAALPDILNQLATAVRLKDRVIKLRAELPQAAITYVDVYAAKYGLISSAKTEGTRLFDFIILPDLLIP